VVALESSVFAHGLPAPDNAEAARRMVEALRDEGAEPAILAVVAGTPAAGLMPDELARFLRGDGVRKASSRDLAGAVADGADAATTVAGALALCRAAGITVLVTGGIGGVHREPPFDESADLLELSRSRVVVICSGAKSVLDLEGTVERLESLSIPVVGYRTDEFPGFHFAGTGLPVSARVDDPSGVATLAAAQWRLGHPGAVLVVQQPPPDAALERSEVELAIAAALGEARESGIRGAGTTPFLLGALARLTGGRSLATNVALLESNARLGAAVARALASHADS
jgi:pseudouridine-5'-phosphate glycosidase